MTLTQPLNCSRSVAASLGSISTTSLNSGSADFPYITSDYHLPIFPAKDGGGIEWEKGISAGPYVIENYEPGVSVKAKRNPNYHRTDAAWFDDAAAARIE